ncbi:threonine aldolase family protein [Gordonia sp. NPDC003504]
MTPTSNDAGRHTFAGDNHAGVHPDVLAAITRANPGHQPAYGGDLHTAALRATIREVFGPRAEVLPVFNGTGANVVALTAATPRWGAVITTDTAHIATSEGGAPEQISGIKLLTAATADGKLTPDQIIEKVAARGDPQRAQPSAVSITQVTELGTVYSVDEIAAICETAHRLGLPVHLDGSRLWNAAAALEESFRAFTTDVGVDVLSLGATKNGALGAEAVVVIDPDRIAGIEYVRKAAAQLPSKMRFLSAQLEAMFTDDLGLRNARHANAMTRRLRTHLEAATADGALPGFGFAQDSPANAIFATLPVDIADAVRGDVYFHDWARERGEVRWMTSWDTTPSDVDGFAEIIRQQFASGSPVRRD